MFSRITVISFISFFIICITTSFKSEDNPLVKYVRGSPGKLFCPEPLRFEEFIQQQNNKDSDQIDMIEQDWYSEVMEKIKKDEYNISFNEELKSFQSLNRENNISFIYHNDGFTAKTMQTKLPLFNVNDETIKEEDKKCEEFSDWEIKIGVNGYSKDNYQCSMINDQLVKFSGEIFVDGNTAYIENDNMRINYTNDEKGMRQDFIIKNKTDGEEKLKLNLSADTKLRMIVGADALMFKNSDGMDMMKYSALKCWDANGKVLRAYFESSFQNENLKMKNEKLNLKIKKEELSSVSPNAKFQIPKYNINQKSQIKNLKSFSIVVNDEDAVYPITIDPLSTSSNWTIEGNTNVTLGAKVTTAGDVNGDGYNDVLISLGDSVIQCYYGSSTGLPAVANWSAKSFGFSSISTAGDVNGDGYSDIIIGDGAYSVQGPFNGRALAYYGSSTGLPLTPNWTVYDSSNADGAQFGSSVSTAGDVNGDGYSDVIVGAPHYTNDVNYEGAVFCYFGSSTGLSSNAGWTVEGNSPGASYHFGQAISLAGDVNGDGYSDILIGAPNWSINKGRVYAYYGSSSGLSATHNWTTFSTQSGEVYGSSASTAGDVNGDGYSDIIIGAPGYDNDSTDEGRVYVYHGSLSGLSASFNWAAEGDRYNSNFGRSVSSAGDINGDGYAEILIGASSFSNTLSTQGKAFMYQGSAIGLQGTANWTTDGEQENAQYGAGLFTAGDVNGDGYSDVIVGSPGYSSNNGKAYLYNGSAAGLAQNLAWSLSGESNGANIGHSVASAGEVNGDGYSDVIIGSPGYNTGGAAAPGRVYCFYGSANGLPLIPSWTITGTTAGTSYHRRGICVATAGDVNGDGYSDVAVGTFTGVLFGAAYGGVEIYYGSSSGLSLTPNWSKVGTLSNSQLGFSVSTAGDVNADGYSDIIIGDYGINSNRGAAYAYYGSATGLPASPNWTKDGDAGLDWYGYTVSTAGDVNGDGYSDVIVGAPRRFNYGWVYAYYGSSNGLSLTANWNGSQVSISDQWYASSVACAGDVNGDGYSDVIVGSYKYYYPNFPNRAGAAFAFYGSSSGLASSNWSAFGDQFNNTEFGWSVSGAGDVNGDGYSDVLVGAPNPFGRVYGYYGSSSGLSGTAWEKNDPSGGSARFGYSVTSAGDVNGDGYSDIGIGARLYIIGGQQRGQAQVYYGNDGGGLIRTVQQYKPSTNNIVSSGGLTGTNGSVKYGVYGRSPYGRSDGKIVYDHKINGVPFNPINSSTNSGSGLSYQDLGITGVQLSGDASGLQAGKEYKWRARVQYDPTNNPYQKLGPWKSYNTYMPLPVGNFKPSDGTPAIKQLSITMFIQGFYRISTQTTVEDTVRVYLRDSFAPYAIVDSAIAYLSSSGQGIFNFTNAINGVNYYLHLKHRNSIETWSDSAVSFTNSLLTFDFTPAASQAHGNNMKQVDTSPVRFAIYSGDVNQDGIVDGSDASLADNDAFNFVTGYVATDVNGDDIVDGSDAAIVDNNATNFVAKITP